MSEDSPLAERGNVADAPSPPAQDAEDVSGAEDKNEGGGTAGGGSLKPALDMVVSPPAPQRPGAAVFSLEGRAAPGLYLVGWLATVLGLAIFVAAVLSSPGGIGAAVLLLTATALLAVGLLSAAGAQGMERRAHSAAYAGPSPFLVFVASVPVALPIAIVALRIAETAGVDPASPLGSVIGQAILIVGLVAFVRLLVVGSGALTWSDMGIRWPGTSGLVGHLAWGAVLAVPLILVTAILSSVLVALLGTVPDSPLPSTREPGGIALNAIAAVLIAPVGEEVFFRGFSLTAWERSLGGRQAIIRSALFFAFVHVLTVGGSTFTEAAAKAAIAFAIRLPVAFALGWVFLQRRSIFASIGLHAAFNGLLVLIAEAATL